MEAERPLGFHRVAGFVCLLGGAFIGLAAYVTELQGGGGGAASGVSAERGESIFWGTGPVDGTCHTCHSMGERGSMTRCPNLGEGPQGPPIWERAAARAAERRAAGAAHIEGPMDYLVESLTAPSAYLVEGFDNLMPAIYKPPVALGPEEIQSVILYLASLSGEEPPAGSVRLPAEVYAAAAGAQERWRPYVPQLAGDPDRGREVFFGEALGAQACVQCHTHSGRGGQVGPDLTGVGASQPVEYLIESIVAPSAVIVAGYEAVAIKTGHGRWDGRIEGVSFGALLKAYEAGEDLEGAVLVRQADNSLERHPFRVSDLVAPPRKDKFSTMPPVFTQALTVEQLHDLVAFLTGAAPPAGGK